MLEIACQGESLVLLADRAVWWPRASTLIVADIHIGKAAAFRARGVPIPHGTTRADLARLARLLDDTAASRLVVLGDLLHARHGRAAATMSAVDEWRARHERLEIILVRGNHDRRAGDPPPSWRIACQARPLIEAPFVFCHHPCVHRRGYCLAGHLHPGVVLSDGVGPSLRAACFWFGAKTAVLPAFGRFTGAAAIQPTAGDRIFAIGDAQVVEISARPEAGGENSGKRVTR